MVPTDELEGYAPKPRRRRAFAVIAVACAAAVALLLALQPASERRVPPFRLPLLDGGTLSSEELRGSPVVVNFFASWCVPCREEAPVLERAWRAYRDRGVRFVGVNVQDTTPDARRFVREYGITYPVVRDAEGTFGDGLGVAGLPQTFFIDEEWQLLDVEAQERDGRSAKGLPAQLGGFEEDELMEQIGKLLQRSSKGP